jgi:hypothetical protein
MPENFSHFQSMGSFVYENSEWWQNDDQDQRHDIERCPASFSSRSWAKNSPSAGHSRRSNACSANVGHGPSTEMITQRFYWYSSVSKMAEIRESELHHRMGTPYSGVGVRNTPLLAETETSDFRTRNTDSWAENYKLADTIYFTY